MKRAVTWLAVSTALLLCLFVSLVLWNQAVFAEYSRDFASLSQARFHALNARMDTLGAAARVVFAALGATDLALIVVSAWARAFVICGVSAVLGIALGGFLLLSMASVSATMVG